MHCSTFMFQTFFLISLVLFRYFRCSVQSVCVSVAFCSGLFFLSVVTIVTRAGLERMKLRLEGESSKNPATFPSPSLVFCPPVLFYGFIPPLFLSFCFLPLCLQLFLPQNLSVVCEFPVSTPSFFSLLSIPLFLLRQG